MYTTPLLFRSTSVPSCHPKISVSNTTHIPIVVEEYNRWVYSQERSWAALTGEYARVASRSWDSTRWIAGDNPILDLVTSSRLDPCWRGRNLTNLSAQTVVLGPVLDPGATGCSCSLGVNLEGSVSTDSCSLLTITWVRALLLIARQ